MESQRDTPRGKRSNFYTTERCAEQSATHSHTTINSRLPVVRYIPCESHRVSQMCEVDDLLDKPYAHPSCPLLHYVRLLA